MDLSTTVNGICTGNMAKTAIVQTQKPISNYFFKEMNDPKSNRKKVGARTEKNWVPCHLAEFSMCCLHLPLEPGLPIVCGHGGFRRRKKNIFFQKILCFSIQEPILRLLVTTPAL
jgi:hypothetical protein